MNPQDDSYNDYEVHFEDDSLSFYILFSIFIFLFISNSGSRRSELRIERNVN